eukprot:gene28584-50452_t
MASMEATWRVADEAAVISFDLDALYREQVLPMTRLAHAIVGSNAVAEELGMVHRDRGDDAGKRSIDDVRRVHASAEPDL